MIRALFDIAVTVIVMVGVYQAINRTAPQPPPPRRRAPSKKSTTSRRKPTA